MRWLCVCVLCLLRVLPFHLKDLSYLIDLIDVGSLNVSVLLFWLEITISTKMADSRDTLCWVYMWALCQ